MTLSFSDVLSDRARPHNHNATSFTLFTYGNCDPDSSFGKLFFSYDVFLGIMLKWPKHENEVKKCHLQICIDECIFDLTEIVFIHALVIHPQWSTTSLLTNVPWRRGWHDGQKDGSCKELTYAEGEKLFRDRVESANFPLHRCVWWWCPHLWF